MKFIHILEVKQFFLCVHLNSGYEIFLLSKGVKRLNTSQSQVHRPIRTITAGVPDEAALCYRICLLKLYKGWQPCSLQGSVAEVFGARRDG